MLNNDEKEVVQAVDNVVKGAGTVFKAAIIYWCISSLVGLSVVCGIIYVICHFLAKLW